MKKVEDHILLKLTAEGKSLGVIAKTFNVDKSTLSRQLKKINTSSKKEKAEVVTEKTTPQRFDFKLKDYSPEELLKIINNSLAFAMNLDNFKDEKVKGMVACEIIRSIGGKK